jgi:uncharacterized protein (DUF1330 family)
MAAYVMAQLDIHDPEGFRRYREKVPATIEHYGGTYLVRGGEVTALEGTLPAPRVVIIEFADRASAEAWYKSPEYQAILPLRLNAARGPAAIIEGI